MRRRLRQKLGREPRSVKTTGFDGGKKLRGRKRRALVGIAGPEVEARLHSAKSPDQDGIWRLLDPARSRLPRLSCLRGDARLMARRLARV